MRSFIRKTLIIHLPLLISSLLLTGSFFILDPFHIIKEYDEFYCSVVDHNGDYVITERFLKNKNKYNSFIFGSSRAGCGYGEEHWEKYLGKDATAFNFGSPMESVYGMKGKLRLINESGCSIDNVLLIIDTDVTFSRYENDTERFLFMKHPDVSQQGWEEFILVGLRDYIFTGFFIRYLDYLIFKKERDYMDGFLLLNFKNAGDRIFEYDMEVFEKRIRADKVGYYERKKQIFYKRDSVERVAEPVISPTKGVEYLSYIKSVFEKHNTSYKIIISPMYDQLKISDKDIKVLNDIFGDSNVYDYSGKNSITDDKYNYYESSHYRIHIGNSLLDSVYATQ